MELCTPCTKADIWVLELTLLSNVGTIGGATGAPKAKTWPVFCLKTTPILSQAHLALNNVSDVTIYTIHHRGYLGTVTDPAESCVEHRGG